jgi:hypothetical protein
MPEDLSTLPVADAAPDVTDLTTYDELHLTTYLRLLDAEAAHADWEEAAQIVLKLDPKADKSKARRVWESHLARAHWLTNNGYRHLLGASTGSEHRARSDS